MVAIKKVVLVLSLTLVLQACGGSDDAGGGAPEVKDPIKLGVATPATGSLALPGDWWSLSIEYAVDEINEAGGIDGREVEIVTVDTQGDPTQAVSVISKLINQDQVDFIMGPLTSDELKAALPAMIEANIGSIAAVGSDDLTPSVMPYGFSILLNASNQAQKMVEYAASTGVSSVAILHDSGLQGRTANEALVAAVEEAGLTLTGNEQFDVGDTDMTAQLLNLKDGAPDHLLLYPTTGDDVGRVLQGIDQLEWDVPVTGGFATNFVDVAKKIAGPDSYKAVTATTYASFGVCPGADADQATADFISGIKKFDPKRAEALSLNFGASTRDGVWILKAAIEGSGSTDGDKIAAWLESNSSSLGENLVSTEVSSSADSHFLFGPQAITVVRPDVAVSEGIFERADC